MEDNPNQILKDDTSLNQNNRFTYTADSPNEGISMDNARDNPITASSNGEVFENMIPDATVDSLISSNLTNPKTEKDSGDIPTVTVHPETNQNTYNLDDIYQSLEESREIQLEIRKILEYGNKLLKVSNSVGISIIFTVALMLGVLLGRVVWRKI